METNMKDTISLILALALTLILAGIGWFLIGGPSPVMVGRIILGVMAAAVATSLLFVILRRAVFKPGLIKSEQAERTH